MENKNPEETPVLNLDGTVSEEKPAVTETAVPNVKPEEIPKKDQDYYVDPLEQDALMQEKLKKIEESRAKKEEEAAEETEKTEPTVDETIRPDMTINGFFSANQTAKKVSITNRPASASALKIGLVIGALNTVFSVIFAIIFATNNMSISWVMGLIYAYVVISTTICLVNALRSSKSTNETLKKYAYISLVMSGITLFPIILVIIKLIAL